MTKLIITTEFELERIVDQAIRKALGSFPTNTLADNDIYLNLKEASAFLNLAPQTIYQHTSMRTIPFFKKGKKLYFSKETLLKWLADGRKKTAEELTKEMDGKGNNHG